MLRACLIASVFSLSLAAQETKQPGTIKPAPRKDTWWQQRHDKCVEHSKAGGVDVAFIGDSITQGWEGGGKAAWETHFAPLKAANYGFSGDGTEHVLWRLTEGKELEGAKPKVAVLMIGTNNAGRNSAKDIALGVETIVKELVKQKPEIKVLLLGVFPRSGKGGVAEPKISKDELMRKIGDINKILAKMDDGKHVFYADISKVFLEEDGGMSKEIMYDYLHLTPKGYERWAEAILPKVNELLK